MKTGSLLRERLLSIEADERRALLWSFLYFFSLLAGYYVLRPVRDAMGASADIEAVFPRPVIDWFAGHGIALGRYALQILFTGTFIAMLLLQPLYGALVSRWPRRVFLPFVYGVFVLCLLGFWAAFDTAVPGRGAAFFIFAAVFNLFAVAVFWSFMADIWSEPQARKLYGYIAAGGTLGGLLGPELTAQLVGRIGVADLLLISAGFLTLSLLSIVALIPAARRAEAGRGVRGNDEAIGGSALAGLRLIARDPLLRWMALLLFFGVGVGTTLYYEQAAIVRASLPDPAAATLFFSRIDRAINWLTLLVQVLLTRQLLTRYGLTPLLLPPLVILVGFSLLAASPLPLMIAVVQVASRAGEFSIGKPARETIYTRVDREARYKASAAIDTVVYRSADLTWGWLHPAMAMFGTRIVFVFGLAIAGAWTLASARVLRHARGRAVHASRAG